MLLIPCPNCGERDESEFDYGGRALSFPELHADAKSWHQILHMREPVQNEVEELWFHHTGCERWIRLHRNPATHEFASDEVDA